MKTNRLTPLWLVAALLHPAFASFAADCEGPVKLLAPPVALVVGSDHRLRFQVRGGTSLPTRALGAALTASASPFWLRRMSDAIVEVAKDSSAALMPKKWLNAFDVGYRVAGSDVDTIPAKGPLVIVANHSGFGTEGLAIASLLHDAGRSDVKIVANQMMQMLPGFKEMTIGVDLRQGAKNKRSGIARNNLRAMREIKQWVAQGGILVIFPAGQVSRYQKRLGLYEDPEWKSTIVRVATGSGVPVLPIYVDAPKPGPSFRWIDKYFPMGVKSTYPVEILRQRGKTLNLTLGKHIAPEALQEFSNDAQAIQFLREQTYQLRTQTQP